MKQLLVKSIVALSLIASNAFADSGEGRSGPDKSGVSIPVKADRGLKQDSFILAVDRCSLPVQRKLIEQLSISSNSDLTSKHTFVSAVSPSNSSPINLSLEMSTRFSKSITRASTFFVSVFMAITSQRREAKEIQVSDEFYDLIARMNGNIALSATLGSYESSPVLIENTFGIGQAEGSTVTSISLANSSKYVEGTLNPTNLVYDSRPFTQCMHNALGQ
jgi:hypothetical protein